MSLLRTGRTEDRRARGRSLSGIYRCKARSIQGPFARRKACWTMDPHHLIRSTLTRQGERCTQIPALRTMGHRDRKRVNKTMPSERAPRSMLTGWAADEAPLSHQPSQAISTLARRYRLLYGYMAFGRGLVPELKILTNKACD